MNTKVLVLIFLFSISETFFTLLISFVCGSCVGYYFYGLIRPNNTAEDVVHFFFSSYNRKYGLVNPYTKKCEHK